MKENKVFIVAELSANHNGKKSIAIETIKAAKRAGANAIKLQTYTPDTITLDCRKEDFKIKQGTVWDGRYLYDLYKEAFTPWEWHEELFECARDLGLVCFSTPFDNSAVDFLEKLGNPIYKIASFEITDIPLIAHAAQTLKPMIISTGIATEEDISLAIKTCREVGNEDITLLKCTSSYPARIEDANLKMILDLKKRFNVKSGLSDHTLGITAPIVAASLGATVIEKHFILDKKIGGPDAGFSLDEQEFSQMVFYVREAEKALGEINYELTEKMKASREFSKSLYVIKDVMAGEEFSVENIKSIRPGFGMHPKEYKNILGKKASRFLERGHPLVSEDILQ